MAVKLATVDFEMEKIGPRPMYPPRPVGFALQVERATPKYYAWGHPTENNTTFKDAQRVLRDVWKNYHLIFHNAKFDYEVGTSWMSMPEKPWHEIHDTLYLIFLQNPDRPTLALKPVAEEVLDLPPNERDAVRQWLIDNKIVRSNDKKWGAYISTAPGKLVGKYAIGDVVRTRKLFDRYYKEIVERGMLGAYDRERKLMPILLDCEQRGVRVDLAWLRQDVPAYAYALEATDRWIAKRLKQRDLNVDSNSDLAEAIQRTGKGDEAHWERTDTGQLSTSKEALYHALLDRSLASALVYRATLATCVRSFMDPWLQVAEQTGGKIFTTWNQVRQDYHSSGNDKGARTARLSSVPNFQNMPGDLEDKPMLEQSVVVMAKTPGLSELIRDYPVPQCRAYIIPDSPNHVLNDRDYSQQELRILAHYEDGALLAAYRDDPWLDMHVFVQQVVSDILGLKIERKPIKTLNFGLIYGMGIKKLAAKMEVELKMAKSIKAAHARGFPGIKNLMDELKARAEAGAPLKTWGGREYFVEPPRLVDGEWRHFDYKLLNRLIQGSAADNTKEAMINYAESTKEGRLIINVHDQILAGAPAKAREQEMRLLRDAMKAVAFDVPMLSEGRWSATRWTEMTELPRGE